MKLLRTDCEELKLETFADERVLPHYAILSHVWLAAEQEITFQDTKLDVDQLKAREGWAKLDYTRKQAHQDGYQYCWIDTLCIDKSSSAELAEAINSMYRWYSAAEACYVYLADMPERLQSDQHVTTYRSFPVGETQADIEGSGDWDSREPLMLELIDLESIPETAEEQYDWDWAAFSKCKWFTRGWTLQEMIAPAVVEFYSASWTHIGPLSKLAKHVEATTGVHIEALQHKWPLNSYSIAQKMSWAARRTTTKVEDQAYSLLGIFDLNLPIIYGEGEKAFQRLQMEMLRTSADQTIFAWLAGWPTMRKFEKNRVKDRTPRDYLELFAKSPMSFRHCARVVPTEQEDRAHESADNGVRFNLQSQPSSTSESELDYLGDSPRLQQSTGLLSRFTTVGKYLRHPTYYTKMMFVVLRCCHQDDPSVSWILLLEKVTGGEDTYLLLEACVRPLNDYWLRNSRFFVQRQFTVLSNGYQERKPLARQSSKDTITVVLLNKKWEDTWKIAKAKSTPSSIWMRESNSFCFGREVDANSGNAHFHGQVMIEKDWCKCRGFPCPCNLVLEISAVFDGTDWKYTSRFLPRPGRP
ncbi:hypothetical protein CKM354_000798300 [Cercospora kikuchii]|uniref:Heterokaryon incompatibility domain-containing protein n=1 Tax=Cercospora kikuchii TaxID=84275 RepID=A0A9P3CM09_9PEZI|nr:uncharacterized protein CKM354_000798300 [Cercospora kikuchii]GIZ44796.1 hypothetical protein CKM354_000798300 [Cercospora kikuchii]